MAENGKHTRPPDYILMASERPVNPNDPFPRATRVGAAWDGAKFGSISIKLDNFIQLQGEPYAYLSLFLTPNKQAKKDD